MQKLALFIVTTGVIVLGVLLFLNVKESFRIPTEDPSKCVYIPGGGHGGYFFKLGQLTTLPDNNNSFLSLDNDEQVYCSSSGCFVAVAGLMGIAGKEKVLGDASLLELIPKIQQELDKEVANNGISSVHYLCTWNRIGIQHISHWLAREFQKLGREQQQKLRSKLNILTTSWSGGAGGVRVQVHKAGNTTEELAHQLRATNWIPYLTGDDWYLQDYSSSNAAAGDDKHLDGDILARKFPPHCDRILSQPHFSWILLRQMFLPVHTQQMIHALWDYGYDVGAPWM